MRKITLFFLMLIMGVGGVNAKTTSTTTVLWEDSYTGNIAIPAGELEAGATVTVYVNAVEGTHLRLFYCLNDKDWTQKTFTDNGGSISDWNWVNAGSESYQFTIAAADMDILNDNTEETGSRGNLMIGSGDSGKLTITKITLTITGSETETGTTTLWSGSISLEAWGNLQNDDMKSASKSALKGDVFRVTITNASAGSIYICNANGWGELLRNSIAEQTEEQTVELEITDAATLEKIQKYGILVRNSHPLTITKVELLTFGSSKDCVPVTIGSDGIATFSCEKDLDFSGTGITAYYASSVAVGKVTLTETETTWNYQGYILVGDEGSYDVPVTKSSTWPAATYLKGKVGSGTVTASTEGTYHYIFAKNSSGVIGFYKLTTDHTLGAKKAYLETTTDITPATPTPTKAVSLVFSDETTGISSVQTAVCEDQVYTLSGVRVAKPTRGLYIVGGRKVFVK